LNHDTGYNVLRSSIVLQDHVSLYSVLNLNSTSDQALPVYRLPAGIGGGAGYANGATVGRLFQLGIDKQF
jgi:hypothetical protein